MVLGLSLERKTEVLSEHLNRGLCEVDFDFDDGGRIWVTSNSFRGRQIYVLDDNLEESLRVDSSARLVNPWSLKVFRGKVIVTDQNGDDPSRIVMFDINTGEIERTVESKTLPKHIFEYKGELFSSERLISRFDPYGEPMFTDAEDLPWRGEIEDLSYPVSTKDTLYFFKDWRPDVIKVHNGDLARINISGHWYWSSFFRFCADDMGRLFAVKSRRHPRDGFDYTGSELYIFNDNGEELGRFDLGIDIGQLKVDKKGRLVVIGNENPFSGKTFKQAANVILNYLDFGGGIDCQIHRYVIR